MHPHLAAAARSFQAGSSRSASFAAAAAAAGGSRSGSYREGSFLPTSPAAAADVGGGSTAAAGSSSSQSMPTTNSSTTTSSNGQQQQQQQQQRGGGGSSPPLASYKELKDTLLSKSVPLATQRAPRGGGQQVADVAVVWLRNDLRLHDNEALLEAWRAAKVVVPVFCFDPRVFATTHYFGFPKTGELRAQFIFDAVEDLRNNLRAAGSDLIIRVGQPEEVLPALVQSLGVAAVFAQKETTDEEVRVEKKLKSALQSIRPLSQPAPSAGQGGVGAEQTFRRHVKPRLELVWGSTLYHLDDLPFSTSQLPDVFTQFRKGVETKSRVRKPLATPGHFGPFLSEEQLRAIGGAGDLPQLEAFGLTRRDQDSRGVMRFIGGETAALSRLQDYFWKKDLLRVYKETRNGMLGGDYSTKFSPWLALGNLSPRLIHAEVMRYEKERVANESTYWVLFELVWRDYFRFVSMKYGNSIFHLGGPRNVQKGAWSTNTELFEAWRTGTTGYPLVDANMRELAATGFMSNRGRQIVCSFLVRDMELDWRLGAEWFESLLLDYDPCSNYGNWTYGAGVGNDPREDRYFSIPKQAQNYDPSGDYVAHWIPHLKPLPKDRRHFPYKLTPAEKALHGWTLSSGYPAPVVQLKHVGGKPQQDVGKRRQQDGKGRQYGKGKPARF